MHCFHLLSKVCGLEFWVFPVALPRAHMRSFGGAARRMASNQRGRCAPRSPRRAVSDARPFVPLVPLSLRIKSASPCGLGRISSRSPRSPRGRLSSGARCGGFSWAKPSCYEKLDASPRVFSVLKNTRSPRCPASVASPWVWHRHRRSGRWPRYRGGVSPCVLATRHSCAVRRCHAYSPGVAS